MGDSERRIAEQVLENLGAPGLRELQQAAADGDRLLCELNVRQQRDTVTVLRRLSEAGACGRTRTGDLAQTVDRLVRWGLVELDGGTLPWAAVTLTDRGRHLLAGMWAPPPKGRG